MQQMSGDNQTNWEFGGGSLNPDENSSRRKGRKKRVRGGQKKEEKGRREGRGTLEGAHLTLHKHRHVHEHVMELPDWSLQFDNVFMSSLDVRQGLFGLLGLHDNLWGGNAVPMSLQLWEQEGFGKLGK